MQRTPASDVRTPWPLRILAGLLFALAALLAGAMQMATGPVGGAVSVQVPFRSQAPFVANVDVAVLTYGDGQWEIESGHQSSAGVAPSEDWHVEGGPQATVRPASGRTAVGIPFAVRDDDPALSTVRGSVTPGGLVAVYGRSAGVQCSPTESRVRAPRGTWLVCVRPRGSEPPSDVAAWRALVVDELARIAAAPTATSPPQDAEELCRIAVLLGATEAREAVKGLWPLATRDDSRHPAPSILLCREGDPPPLSAMIHFASDEGADESLLLRALAESRVLAAPVREAAQARIESHRRLSDGRATLLDTVSTAVVPLALLLLVLVASRRRHEASRRAMAVAALVGGLLLAACRVPVASVVPAPAVGLAVAAGALVCVSRQRRMLVAAGLLATAALGRAVGGSEISLLPDTVLGTLAFAGLVLVPGLSPGATRVRTWTHRGPGRPAHSRGAMPQVLTVLAAIGVGLLAAILITADPWLDWLWPRSGWDVAVALAAAPVIGHLIALGRPFVATLRAIVLTIATLYLALLHMNAIVAALADRAPAPGSWMPRDAGISVLYAIVAVFAVVRLARWRPPGSVPLV